MVSLRMKANNQVPANMKESAALWLIYTLVACAFSLGLKISRRVHWLVPALWFTVLGLGLATLIPALAEPRQAMNYAFAVLFLVALITAVVATARIR